MQENMKELDFVPLLKECKKNKSTKKQRISNIEKQKGDIKENVKPKAGKKNTKSSAKVTKKYCTPKIVLKEGNRSCDLQLKNMIETRTIPLKQVKLSAEELKTLYTKYKVDGHYIFNTNSPFTEVVNNSYDKVSGNNSYDVTNQYQCVNEISPLNSQSTAIEDGSTCYNTGNAIQYPEENIHFPQNFMYDSGRSEEEFLNPINVNNNIDNNNFDYRQNSLVNDNYRSPVFANCGAQMYHDSIEQRNVLDLDQTSNSNNVTSNSSCQSSAYNMTLHNYPAIHDSNVSIDECNGDPLTNDGYNYLTHRSYNAATYPWNSTHSSDLEISYEDKYKPNPIAWQSTNISSNQHLSEEKMSFNGYVSPPVNASLTENELLTYASNSVSNVQQNSSSFYENSSYTWNSSSVISNETNYLTETNAFTSYSVNITE